MTKRDRTRGTRRLLAIAGAAAVLVAVILYQTGAFHIGRATPGTTGLPPSAPEKGRRLSVKLTDVPRVYTAVGAVRSRDEVEISPRKRTHGRFYVTLGYETRSGDLPADDYSRLRALAGMALVY